MLRRAVSPFPDPPPDIEPAPSGDALLARTPALAHNPLLGAFGPEDWATFAAYLEIVAFPAGTAIVREGSEGQDMYFLLEGAAELRRGAVDLGPVGPGAHFGELALIARRLRAAAVVATMPVVLARLSRARYDAMSAEAPALALRFTQALVGSLGLRLTDMTDSVGILLRERSLPRRVFVDVRRGGAVARVRTGTHLRALLPAEVAGVPVVAGLLDHKAASLDTPVMSSVTVEPLTLDHWEGKRIYRQSLGLLFLEAARRVEPGSAFRLGPSIGYAQWVERAPSLDLGASGPAATEPASRPLDPAELAARVTAAMRDLIAMDVAFRHELWTVEEARSHFDEQRQRDASLLLRTSRESAVPMVTCGELYALGMTPLLPSAGLIGAFAFRVALENGGLLLHYGEEAEVPPAPSPPPAAEPGGAPRPETPPLAAPGGGGGGGGGVDGDSAGAGAPSLPSALEPGSRSGGKAVRGEEPWLTALGVTSVGAFNEACIVGSVSQIIQVSEGLHEKRIGQIADAITDRAGRVRVICIAGPSSSGKTTFIKRLTVQLQVNGINPVAISLDDYYLDREKTARDARGEYDFEALEALNLDLLHDQLARLLSGEAVNIARYDFTTGRSLPAGGPRIALRGSDMLLLEGIHGLNPRIFASILDRSAAFRVFVQPATSLPFDALSRVNVSDLRLLRRIVRDRHHRAIAPADNIVRWPSVRAGERIHIFPWLGHADAVFDSALAYELSVIKVFADRYLLEVPQAHPAFVTAHRLRQLLDRFITIYPDHVPPTSILREFIGGSGFEY